MDSNTGSSKAIQLPHSFLSGDGRFGTQLLCCEEAQVTWSGPQGEQLSLPSLSLG